MRFREPLVADLPRHQGFRDDSLRLAALLSTASAIMPIRPTFAAPGTPIQCSFIPIPQLFPERHGGTLVGYLDSLTGAAENADLFHAAILNLASAK